MSIISSGYNLLAVHGGRDSDGLKYNHHLAFQRHSTSETEPTTQHRKLNEDWIGAFWHKPLAIALTSLGSSKGMSDIMSKTVTVNYVPWLTAVPTRPIKNGARNAGMTAPRALETVEVMALTSGGQSTVSGAHTRSCLLASSGAAMAGDAKSARAAKTAVNFIVDEDEVGLVEVVSALDWS